MFINNHLLIFLMEKEKSTHAKEKKEDIAHSDKNKENLTDKFKENPWILATLVLGVLVLVLLLVGGFSGLTRSKVTGDDAGKSIVTFLNSQTGGGVEYVSSEDMGNVYKITVSYQNQNIPVYVTKDGEYYVQGLVPITETLDSPPTQPPSTEVPKSDKPVVELFVMSYCPYGTQAEKGILPAIALLGNKVDFKLRTVDYILHGEKEDLENKRELCIREEQGQDKLNKYLVCILNSTDTQAPADVSACEKKAGINSAKLQTCLKTKADDYFAADSVLSKGYGVRGSPTLIINGVESNAGRSPASYLQGICDAFTSAPSECNEQLSSSTPSAGFGYQTGTDTVAQC